MVDDLSMCNGHIDTRRDKLGGEVHSELWVPRDRRKVAGRPTFVGNVEGVADADRELRPRVERVLVDVIVVNADKYVGA